MKCIVRRISRQCGLHLSDVQIYKVDLEVKRTIGRSRVGWAMRVVAIFSSLIALAAFIWSRQFAPPTQLLYQFAPTAAILGVWYLTWKTMYQRLTYKAITTLGFAKLCASCGYDLQALPDDVKQCPECGAEIVSLKSEI